MTVDIALATYNGDRFLDAQLQSILRQDYPHWHLLVRDDGSCDRTPTILQTYRQQEPERLQWINLQNSKTLAFSATLITCWSTPHQAIPSYAIKMMFGYPIR
ncbi:MAG: glycosyltransferase [Acaryochloridaceae cyanobacterium SU_2_1]|nr:glycosyltransferase [Acaryochloridaceae cyanobacterium SU_2_1]